MSSTAFPEQFAISKYPIPGRCRASHYQGIHRGGTFPIESVLDGGLPGDWLAVYCLDCGKFIKRRGFMPIKQPNKLGGK